MRDYNSTSVSVTDLRQQLINGKDNKYKENSIISLQFQQEHTMTCIGTNNSDNNCNTTDNMNSNVSSAIMNYIEKTPITSNIGLHQIPGIQMITNQTSTTIIDQIPCAKNNNILIQKCQSDDTKIT